MCATEPRACAGNALNNATGTKAIGISRVKNTAWGMGALSHCLLY